MNLQLESLMSQIDELQQKHGHPDYVALYGTGCIDRPRVMFLFMNPTARNLTVRPDWQGIRAPWIGLKNTWKLMRALGIIDDQTSTRIQAMKTSDWNGAFAEQLYEQVARNGAYLTNLARCTQPDARHVHDSVFRESRDVTLQEIALVQPQVVIAFGNQVASNLLQRDIRVSEWRARRVDLTIGDEIFGIYPTYYPVGMGLRNIGKAIEDIQGILSWLP